MSADRAEQLANLADRIAHLSASPLYDYRLEHGYEPVIGEGSSYARIMFIGEAPGKREAETGRPFVGASGRLLDEFLDGIGLARSDVYITNVVKDRPLGNRDPRTDEIALYTPFLVEQIDIIQPHVIATLGRFAMDFVFDLFDMPQQGQKISDVHGSLFTAEASYGEVAVVPLYHPAVALYNAGQKDTLRDDFAVLKQFLD